MEQEILNKNQKIVIEAVAKEPKLKEFYLSGGTALAAYYLKHRFSNDLDFFIFQDPDRLFLHSFSEKLKDLIKADKFDYEKLYDRSQFYFNIAGEELKLEFTKYPFKQLAETTEWNGIRVDSLKDIAANKLMAMLDRFDPKDFADLFFLLQDFKLSEIKKDAEIKFGAKIDDLFLGSELAKVKRIEALPKMIKKITVEELKEFFENEAKKLKNSILE